MAFNRNNRAQFMVSPQRVVGRSRDASGSEFSSFDNQDMGGAELTCDECHCPKRHPDMTWWWDEKCSITVCESCCLINHRDHPGKRQDVAESEEMESYKKFLLDNKSLTEKICADIVEQREMLQQLGRSLVGLKGLGDYVRCFIEKNETQLTDVKEEISTARDIRLTNQSYLNRNEIRGKTKQVLVNVDEGLKEFSPSLDKLVKQFHHVKSILAAWEHQGMTDSDNAVAAESSE